MSSSDQIDSTVFESLPEGFIANAMARTSPRDVCTLSLVCSVFRSAAGWDVVWEKFLPKDYRKIVVGDGCSKKELYLRLCDYPVIIDNGNKSFWLHKLSGKKCYMLAARDLSIIWSDTPRYWRWISVPESRYISPLYFRFDLHWWSTKFLKIGFDLNSRFPEVAELVSVCWLEVRGRIDTSLLSTDTGYAAYLVFKTAPHTHGFEYHPVEVSVGLSGVESQNESQIQTVFLEPEVCERYRHDEYELSLPGRRRMGVYSRLRGLASRANATPPQIGPKRRQDGWLEIELGEFYNGKGQEGELEMSMMEVKGGNWKGGLIIQGIEIRPKSKLNNFFLSINNV